MTNSNEGYIFVNQSNSNVTQYIAELFPTMSEMEVQQGAAIYSSVPNITVAEQCNLVMGECKILKSSCFWLQLIGDELLAVFICPSYTLLHAFGAAGYKVNLLIFHVG
jgi:hypothetical protein